MQSSFPNGKQFDSILKKCGVTSQPGRDYVTQSLDPFHDSSMRLVGLPDSRTGSSIIRHVKKRVNLSKPAALSAGNWDCHIVAVPYAATTDTGAALASNTYDPATGEFSYVSVAPALLGPLLVCSSTTGSSTFNVAVNSAAREYSSLDISDVLSNYSSSYRVVSGGFEVIDRTAVVDQQGSVTVYRQVNAGTTTTPVIANGAFSNVYPITTIPGPPSTSSDAEQVSGGTWQARDGVYCPLMVGPAPPQMLGPQPIAMLLDSGGANNALLPRHAARDGSINQATRSITPNISMTGAYFRGLKDTANLDVILRLVIEEFPATYDAASMTLAGPTPALDNQAMRCVSELFENLPVGVPVGLNPLGEWFDMVTKAAKGIGKAGEMVGKVAGAVASQPMLAPIAMPISAAAQVVKTAAGGVAAGSNALAKMSRKRASNSDGNTRPSKKPRLQ